MSVEEKNTVNLSHELKQLYHPGPKDTYTGQQRRQKACEEMFKHLTGLLHEKITTDAKLGHPETRLLEFKHKDNLKFGGCFAKDLLTKGDVVNRLQKYLDTEHDDGSGEPVFFVYFTSLGRYQENYEDTKFALFVNWDKNKWSEIKSRLSHHSPHPSINGREMSGRGTRGLSLRNSRGRRFYPHGQGVGRGGDPGLPTKTSSPVNIGGISGGTSTSSPLTNSDELPLSHNE